MAQIAADELQIDIDRITVRYGDTDTVPQGVGTMGSRITAIAGQATQQASRDVVAVAKRIAAHKLEASPDDVELTDGVFAVAGTPSRSVTWADVGWAGLSPTQLPDDLKAGCLEAQVFAEATGFTFPNGAYICVVGSTGRPARSTIEQFHMVDGAGPSSTHCWPRVRSKVAWRGHRPGPLREHGVLARGPAADVDVGRLPRAVGTRPAEPASIGRTYTTTPHNSLGAKGIGESGAIGAPPAVINAVVDALSGFGVRHIDMPATPEKVWRLMNGPSRRTRKAEHDADPRHGERRRATDEVEARLLLVHYLRELRQLTGTHVGCDTSSCGACTVHLDGSAVKSCTVLAVQADGTDVLTIEGLPNGDRLHPVQEGFRQCHGVQCGYCTPGMIMAAAGLLAEKPHPTEEEVRNGLEGNICRCTGYQKIVDAVRWAAEHA